VVELDGHGTIEHGSTRAGRWLRERRLRIALSIAVAEGVLVVLHLIPRWPAIIVAAAAISLYIAAGRKSSQDVVRHATWIGAASQSLMILVPVFVSIFLGVAIILLAIIAVVALVILFTDRN
jgi:hypothetical protein